MSIGVSSTKLLVRLLWFLLARLALPVNHALGAGLGWCMWVLPTRAKRLSMANIERCFPEQSEAWQRKLARCSLMETGKALTEAPLLWRAGMPQLERWLHDSTGLEVVEAALAQGKGVCFAVPHLGSWEFAGFYGTCFGSLTTLYRPPRQIFLEQILLKHRSRHGAHLVPANRYGIRALKQALQAGTNIGILPDQAPKGKSGIMAPFFGHDARTMILISRLTQANKIPVVFAFARRLPRGQGFHYHFEAATDDLYSADPLQAATALNSMIEKLVRSCPEQYLWSYKRWPRN